MTLSKGASADWRHLPPWLIALVALPVVLFYAILLIFNTNLPIEDDFNGLFNFSLQWMSLPDLAHRLPMLVFFQHNEYRMPVVFSLLASELQVTHHISLPLWTWAGNLLVLVILVPLWLRCSPELALRQRLFHFAPVAWIMMSLGYAETVDFALCGMQFVFVTALSVLAMYCITHPKTGMRYLGCVLALLACGTYVNAFVMAPAGLPLLFQNGKRRVFCAWIAAFAVGVIPYVWRYHFGKHEHPDAGHTLLFFFTLLGGPIGFHAMYIGSALLGIGITALFVYLAWKRADRVSPFAFWLAVWLVLGFVLIAFGRAGFGETAALSSRYKIWSDLLLAALYLLGLDFWKRGYFPRLQQDYVLPTVVATAVLFGLGSDALGWYRLHWRKVDVTYGISRYVSSGGTLSPAEYPHHSPDYQSRPGFEEFARERLTGVTHQGLYHLPAGKTEQSDVRY